MRTFLNGAGVDVTAAAIAYLTANPTPLLADLFEFKTIVQGALWSQDLLLTTQDRPLRWSHVGTFLPANILRGAVESKIGLEVVSLELDWVPDGVMYGDLSILQSFNYGLWDNATVRLLRLLMPTLGDGDTYGACEMFTGRLAEHSFTRMGVHLKVNSATELLDQQLPPNLVEPSNPQARYGTGQPPAGLSSVPVFAAVAGSPPSVLLADETSPNPGQLLAPATFDFGYVWFTSGANTGLFRNIRFSDQGAGHNRFHLYEALPFAVEGGDTFKAYVPYVRAASEELLETHTIPSSSPYEIAVASADDYVGDEGVKYHGGSALVKVPANPVHGQYVADLTGSYLFAAADTGDQVDIAYRARVAGFAGFPFVPAPEAAL